MKKLFLPLMIALLSAVTLKTNAQVSVRVAVPVPPLPLVRPAVVVRSAIRRPVVVVRPARPVIVRRIVPAPFVVVRRPPVVAIVRPGSRVVVYR